MSTVVTEEITYETQVTPNNLAKQGDANVSTRPPVNQVKEERKDSLASDKDGDAKDEKDKESGSSGEDSIERPVGTVSYVGWKQVGGWEEGDRLTPDDLFTDAERDTMLSQVLPRSLYGDYYHSIGIFFIGGFLSFLLGYFKFNVGPVFFVILATSFLYRASIKKHRASVRDLVQKEMTVERVEDDYESMEWLNNFLDKFWPRLEPNLSKLILDQVNVELAKNPSVPGFIQALWVDQFTLGIKPPRIELVKTLQNTEPNITVMDWCVSFTPHDLNDLGAKQLKNYINQRIIVKAKMYGVTIPVFVNDVSFRTFVRIRMKMMTPFPHIETVNIQSLEVPDFDFVFKLFGDTIFNWELMSIPGLLPFAKEMIKKYAGPLLLPPFSLQLNVPQLISESALSIGVLEINVREATKLLFPRAVLESEVINPYLEFEFNNTVVGRTKIIKNSLAPVWNEKLLVLLGSFTDPLSVTVYSKREKLNDKVIGRVQYNLSSLQENHTQKECVAPILNNSKRIGDLIFDLNFHPTLEPKKLPDGTVEDLPDLNTGITKIVIEEGKFSNFGKEKATTSIEVFINAKSVLTTSVFKKDNKPQYKAEHEVIIRDRRKTRVKVVVKDGKGTVISTTIQSLNDLIGRTQVDNEWIPLPGSKGELKVTTHWKPVALESGTDSAAYNPPIGVIRVFMNKAEDLRNLERIGKIDPYARVLVNGTPRGRTDSKKSTLNPIWNQAIYIPITSPNQRVTIECMDVETAGKDRTLGKFDVKTNYLFEKGPDDKYVERIDEEPKVGKLVSKKGVKGTVSYYLSFYPALPVLTLEEILELDAINERKRQLGELKEAVKQKPVSSEEKKKLETEEQEIKELDDLYSNKMKLDVDELLQYPAGVFAFNVLGGEMPQAGTYLQVFFDSEGYSSATSSKYATKTVRQGTSGDSMVKGLQWSVTTFRATKNPHQNRAEDCLCEVDVPTIELVRNCYYKPSIVTLRGNSSAKIMLQVSWFPILVSKIPQVDLISNTGDLEIVFHSANRLIASDRNGKSDPYVKIYLDDSDESIYKTKTKKKTLDPVWEESTQLEISNRVNNYLKIRVMDWDAGNADDLIGTATVPLADVNPGSDTYMDVPLTGPNNEDGGVLHLTFRFAPRHVISVSKIETKVGDLANKGLSAGLHAGTSVIGTGLGAVGKLKKGILGGGKKKDKDDQYE